MQQQLTDEGNVNRTTGDASGSSMVAASDAGSATAVARRPRILLVTDRTPGGDSGYGMRVDNVIVGLMEAGDLHVCLIDSSTGGASLPVNAGYETTTIRAENPPRWRKLLLAATSLAQVPYRRQAHLRTALAQRFGDEPWDVVWFSRIRTYSIFRGLVGGSHVVDFDDLNDRLAKSLIADRTDLQGHLRAAPRNLLGHVEARRWSKVQRRIAAEVCCVTVCSEADRSYLDLANCVVVRNGYRTPHTARRLPDHEHPTLVFVGPLSYEPNRLAAEWLAFDVLPLVRRQLPAARLVVVGYNDGVSARLRHAEGVTLTGYVHDLSAYYATASVAVAPLRSGGGTRLKVMEALARSVPLVATSTGCFGLDLTHDQELLIADDAEGFAQACVSIINDPALAGRLTEAGRARYVDRLTAEASSKAVAGVASSLAAVTDSVDERS
ncbi:MAG: glycosyltransferase [Acidimicrobiaceae bacterium]|nr:glycosyltransferase [Acidimicrobiaceae bacterium]